MKKYERASLEEFRELILRLRNKTIEDMITMFGPPAREWGARTEERWKSGPLKVAIRREVLFRDIGPTIRRLIVSERVDGKLEFNAQGKEITDDTAA